jgi:hypothetical protein
MQKKIIYLVLIFCFLFILPANLLALPNIGVDAGTLPEGISFVRERYFYADYTKRYNEDLDKYESLESNEYYKSHWSLTEIAYGVTNKLTLVANIWYFDAKIKSGSVIGDDKGIGDCYAFSKYKMLSIESEPDSGIVGLLGARFPTGDKKNMPILRLGDGSTDLGVGFAATKQWGRTENSLFGGIWLNNKSDEATDKRNEVECRATTQYNLLPRRLNLQMELKGVWFEGNEEHLLELAPGIQYTPIFPLTLQISTKIPVISKGYFKYDYQIVIGLSFGMPIFHAKK